jgi:hypothetical protein
VTERNHYELLALAVIAQAKEDLRTRRGTPLYVKAFNWVKSDGFEITCAEADLCPIQVRRKWHEEGLI